MEATKNNSKNIEDASEKTICIVQLTRLGDLIQTLQVARKIKQSRQDIRLALVARKNFAAPLAFLLNDVFDHVHLLDYTEITNKETNSLDETINNLDSFLNEINSLNISALVNLSFSKSSGYLCGMIKAVHKLGVLYNPANSLVIQDNWSQYVYSSVLENGLNPFSLTDLYSNILGVDKLCSLPEAKIGKGKRVLIHPFASLSRKKWKTSKWAELIYKLLKEDSELVIDLVGGKDDREEIQGLFKNPVLKSFLPRINNYVGKKSIKEVYELLDDIDLFIGHDSMVGHLASLKNIQTITISLGSVRPAETTPYQAGGFVLSPRTKCFPCQPDTSCELFQCHSDISYQVTFAVIDQIRKTGNVDMESLSKNISSFHLTSVNISRSEYSQNGYYRLNSLSENTPDIKEIFRDIFKITWSFLLDDKDETTPYPLLTQTTHQELLNSINGFQHLFELCEFGKRYSKFILQEVCADTPDINKIKEYGKKIDEIDNLKQMLARTNPYIAPITSLYRMKKGNLAGENIVQLTESSYGVYNECGSVCSVISELIEKTIAEYKIKSGINTKTKTTNI